MGGPATGIPFGIRVKLFLSDWRNKSVTGALHVAGWLMIIDTAINGFVLWRDPNPSWFEGGELLLTIAILALAWIGCFAKAPASQPLRRTLLTITSIAVILDVFWDSFVYAFAPFTQRWMSGEVAITIAAAVCVILARLIIGRGQASTTL